MILALFLAGRLYFPLPLTEYARIGSAHPHVEVTGKVTLAKTEEDGDRHLRISDGAAFIVAECIPLHRKPCRGVKVGAHVRVRGISRRDLLHDWWEIHPVESLEILP